MTITSHSNDGAVMRSSTIGRIIVRAYRHLPFKARFLALAVKSEGGDMTSSSLRAVLSRHFGVEVGEYSYGSLLVPGHADRGTRLGRYVSVGPNVRRFGAAHPLERLSMHPYFYNPAYGPPLADVARTECAIESDSWIGANVVILPSCSRIGVGAVVGAGSIVTRDVPDFAIVVGVPAKIIGYRFTAERREHLIEARHWELEPSALTKVISLDESD